MFLRCPHCQTYPNDLIRRGEYLECLNCRKLTKLEGEVKALWYQRKADFSNLLEFIYKFAMSKTEDGIKLTAQQLSEGGRTPVDQVRDMAQELVGYFWAQGWGVAEFEEDTLTLSYKSIEVE